mgnify:FL=1
MNMRVIPAVLRAAARQAAADLRPVILGTGIVSLLLAILPVVMIGRLSSGAVDAGTSFGPMMVTGSIGAFGCFITLQIVGEMYTDRVGGALLRVRILPHGPAVWAVGKALSSIVNTLVIQAAVLLAAVLFVDALPLGASQVLTCLPLIMLSAVATAPLGFLMGALARGLYSIMFTYFVALAIIATGGFLFPLGWLPRWAQAVQLVLPPYWAGHLTRWALAGDPAWEVGGAFSPALATGILVAWAVVGFAAAPLVIRRSFRRESIGTLSRMQSTIRSQSGL